MMLTPEQLWLDRRDKLNLTELKACGDAMARKIQENTASLLAAADYINTLEQMLNSSGQRIAELENDERAHEVSINDLIDKNNTLEQKLRGIANYLRNAGATLPAPPAAGTIESAMNHGLCIALLVVEEAMQPTWPEDTSDYGSRIAAIGQNGNDGLHYDREQEGGKDASA